MPTPGDMLPQGVNGLALKVAALERELRELRAARRLESASISGGAFAVITPTGGKVFKIGKLANTKYGTELRRDDGTLAMSVSSQDPGADDMIRTFSRDGHIVISDDAWADGYLGRPWVPVPMAAPYGITAASWVTTHIGVWWVQHRVLELRASVYAPAATTGQIRFRAIFNGASTILGPTATAANDSETYLNYRAIGSDLVGVDHEERVVIIQEAQRTVGAGTVNCWHHSAWGSNTYDSSEA